MKAHELDIKNDLEFISKVQKTYGEEAFNKCIRQFSGKGSYKKVDEMPPQTVKNFVLYLKLLIQDAS